MVQKKKTQKQSKKEARIEIQNKWPLNEARYDFVMIMINFQIKNYNNLFQQKTRRVLLGYFRTIVSQCLQKSTKIHYSQTYSHQPIAMTTLIFKTGQKIKVSERQKAHMKFFQQSEFISNNPHEQIKIQLFDYSLYCDMIKLLQLAEQINYNFEDYPTIRTSTLSQVIPQRMAKQLQKLSIKHLNSLYLIAHFFVCASVRKIVVAAVACRFYIGPSLKDYQAKKAELGIKKDLNEHTRSEMKDKYPFYN